MKRIFCWFGWHEWACPCGQDFCRGIPNQGRFCIVCRYEETWIPQGSYYDPSAPVQGSSSTEKGD